MANPNQSTLSQSDPGLITMTGTSNGTTGDVAFYAGRAGILETTSDTGIVNAIRVAGVIKVRKDTTTCRAGHSLGWDKDGTSVDGVTGGAATVTDASKDFPLGRCIEFAGTANNWALVVLNDLSADGTATNMTDSMGTFTAGTETAIGQLYLADASTGTETATNGGTMLLVNTAGTFGVIPQTEINHNFGLAAVAFKQAAINDHLLLNEINAIKAALRDNGIAFQYTAV